MTTAVADENFWVKLTSWHIVDTVQVEADGPPGMTLCGRPFDRTVEVHKDWYGNEKTCESCLRINAES